MKSYLDAMQRYFDFSGRSSRTQYWLFALIGTIIALIAGILDGALGTRAAATSVGILGGLVGLVHFIPALAVGVRRLHDINRTGWWLLIALVPLVGAIVLLVFYCTPSTPGPNRFGPQGNASDRLTAAA
ncbi:MAG TPA: DUF805 domain-containing protein [Devosiaceae bacterium]|jgi:uncharacterized membrane protein YhaH (DUF805 family)